MAVATPTIIAAVVETIHLCRSTPATIKDGATASTMGAATPVAWTRAVAMAAVMVGVVVTAEGVGTDKTAQLRAAARRFRDVELRC